MCRINVRTHLHSSCLLTIDKGDALRKTLLTHLDHLETCIVDFSDIDYFSPIFWKNSYVELANQLNYSFEQMQEKLILEGLSENEINFIKNEITAKQHA